VTVPDFSVVVPTFRRPEPLARCVASMARLDANGPSFEALIVDDGGGDVDVASAAAGLRALDRRCEVLRVAHAGPGAARNAGARAARGRWLAFTDDDCEPRADWLCGFAAGFERRPGAALGGRTINRLDTSVLASAHQLLVDFLTHGAPSAANGARFFPSNNLALPRERFLEIGGFDHGFPFAAGEDRDLCARWQAAGGELGAEPRAVIEHGHALDLSGFCRMHARYGRGARRFRRLEAARHGARVRLEPPRFYAGLLAAPLRGRRPVRAALLSLALLLSQLCHAGGYLREWLVESELSAGRSARTRSRSAP
jgi:glycosyltransferase involved in cell wall biosynthesis